MSSLCLSLIFSLLVTPAGLVASQAAPGTSGTAAAATAGDRAERTARAARFFEGGRYVEAALEFEALRRDFPGDASILFNAAASRDAAGHFAHAVAYLRQYLARSDLGPDDRKQGEEQLAESARKVTPVALTVALPLEGPQAVTVIARPVPTSPADLRPELSFPLRSPRQPFQLELDPGAWVVRVEGPGYEPAEQQIDVATAPLSLSLRPQLVPVAEPEPPRPERVVPPEVIRATTRGLYISGGAVAALGLGLIGGGVGMVHGDRVQACSDPTLASCRKRFAGGLALRNVGTSFLGAGAGLAASALVWRAGDPRKRVIAWSALAAVGGVGLILGEVLVIRGAIPFSRDNTGPGALAGWSDHWGEHRHSALPALAGTLRGLGVGLVAGAVTGLVVQRKHLGKASALRVDPSAGPGHTGLVLSGRF
jgi:hypothetical protein